MFIGMFWGIHDFWPLKYRYDLITHNALVVQLNIEFHKKEKKQESLIEHPKRIWKTSFALMMTVINIYLWSILSEISHCRTHIEMSWGKSAWQGFVGGHLWWRRRGTCSWFCWMSVYFCPLPRVRHRRLWTEAGLDGIGWIPLTLFYRPET